MTQGKTGNWIPQQKEMAEMLFAATQEMFTSMLGSEIQQLSASEAERSTPFDGVLSLIGLAGALIGNGALVCSAEAACGLSSRLLDAEFSSVDEQVLDAVGEITNMIVGGFKNLLESQVGPMQMSVPSVIFGENISTRDAKADVSVSVRYAFPAGVFGLTIRLGKGLGVAHFRSPKKS
jgi:chemotaxis protein CheX